MALHKSKQKNILCLYKKECTVDIKVCVLYSIILGLVRLYDKVKILNLLLNFNNEQLNYKRINFKTEIDNIPFREGVECHHL